MSPQGGTDSRARRAPKPGLPASGLIVGDDGRARCFWHGENPLYRRYHDEEWGRPVASDHRLFEKICLEGFQSGLSWLTILRKREAFRAAFAGFDYRRVAAFDDADVARLLADSGIVRHRGKIVAAIENARRASALADEVGSLAVHLWRYRPAWRAPPGDCADLRARVYSPESQALANDLKARGFRFVGPTTLYAFMQACGMVNDHIAGCCVADAVAADQARFVPPL